MEKKKVIIDLDEYNELVRLTGGINDGKVLWFYTRDHFEYRFTCKDLITFERAVEKAHEINKELAEAVKFMTKKDKENDFNMECAKREISKLEIELFEIQQLSMIEFVKWKRNKFKELYKSVKK